MSHSKTYVYPLGWVGRWYQFLAVAFLVVAVAAAAYGVITVIEVAGDLISTVITGGVSLIAVLLSHAFQRARALELSNMQRTREIELSELQKRQEMELSERQKRQENYERILERMSPYLRRPDTNEDEFATACLHAWISGSVGVVNAANDFAKKRDASTLDTLLNEMRKDISLERDDDVNDLHNVTTEGLFRPRTPEPEPGLR